MVTDTQKRQLILKKIYKIPDEKLKELDDFITKLEQGITQKNNVLSFAGAWQDIDDSILSDLTDNLILNRQRNKRRDDE